MAEHFLSYFIFIDSRRAYKMIVIYVDVMERLNFFSKFNEARNFSFIFITAKYSVYKKALSRGLNVHLLTRTKLKTEYDLFDFSKSLSVLNGYHTYDNARTIASQVSVFLENLHREESIDMFFIWNGTTTIARAISVFAKQNYIKTRFFEISNVGESIFVDCVGTNANSCLYQKPEVLDKIDVDEKKYKIWLSQYIANKKTPLQSKNRSKIPWHGFIDWYGYIFKKAVWEDRRIGIKVVIGRLINKVINTKFLVVSLNTDYAFLPLQVSDDAQLKLFSKYNNKELIKLAISICKERNVELMVKIHPAESSRKEIQEIVNLSKIYKFHIVNNKTDELIINASFVIVNNSTVGLEAKIYNKQVMMFGEAFYKEFDEKRLKSYILNYLVEADYFGNKPISISSLKKILKRSEICQ